jgi:dipeptidyl aminopeptidase/acylaminoacyl peptidase
MGPLLTLAHLAPCVPGWFPALAPASQSPAWGRDTLLTVERYLDYETVASPAVSPDGRQVVYTRRSIDRMKDTWESALWVVDADGSRNRFLVKGSSPVWSPDGTRLAYLAPGEPGGPQIYVRWMDGRAGSGGTQVTRVSQPPANLRWSPDGTRIGFSLFVPDAPEWRVDLPRPPAGAEWTLPPRLVERLHYKGDRVGLVDPGFTHVFVVPATGGTPRDLTPGRWSVGQIANGFAPTVGWDWLRDGRTIVVEGNDAPDADRQFRVSNIYAVDVATGARRRLTTTPGFWINPLASPDGKLVAYLGFAPTRQSYRVLDLHTTTIDGREVKLLTRDFDRSPSDPVWAPDNSGLYFVAEDRGTVNLHFVPKGGGGGGPRQLTTGTHVLTAPSVSRRNTAVVVRSHFHRPPDLARVDLRRPSALTPLTDVNADLLGGVRLGDVEEIWYLSTGGTRVQGWIVKPPFFDPERKYPLALEIHGGPHAMYAVGFEYLWQALAASGFVVLYTNPRGSTGYGTAFGNAVDKAWPGADYDDLMAGVDTVIGRGYVDGQRLFVGGCSGGGILTSWIIGKTDRFAAATVRCPIANWISAVGTSDIPLVGANLFEKPFWENPAAWLERSPVMHVGNVRTPTLLMTGVLDLRTPIGQTEEYFTALQMRGVPAAMLRFEGEWHGTTARPSNWMRTVVYMMEWYRRWERRQPG